MAIVIETTQINAKFLGGLALNKIMLGIIEIFPNIATTPEPNPSDMFVNGEQGAWYDFYDSMDTKIAFRRNLLLWSEAFDNSAVWAFSRLGVAIAPVITANAGNDPLGNLTADRVQFALNGGVAVGDISRIVQTQLWPVGSTTLSMWLRSFDGVSSYNMHLVDPVSATRAITVTGSWQRFEVTTTTNGTSVNTGLGIRGGQNPANSDIADVLVWGAQVEVGATASPYQKVTDWNTEFLARFPGHALYQDSVGRAPITNVEQPLGLALDKRLGLVLGPELAPDTAPNLNILRDGVGPIVGYESGNVLTLGQWHRISFTVHSNVGTNVGLVTIGGAAVPTLNIPAGFNGTLTGYVLASSTQRVSISPAGPVVDFVLSAVSFKELPSNHAIQATAANRPVLSARKNLLVQTEQFSFNAWNAVGAAVPVVTPDFALDPLGGTTADRLQTAGGGGIGHGIRQIFASTLGASATYTSSIWVKSNTGVSQQFRLQNTHASVVDNFELNDATTSWQRFDFTVTNDGSAPGTGQSLGIYEGADTDALDILIWGAQLEFGPTATRYQRVNTATDYDTMGFPFSIRWNGVNNNLRTPGPVDFSGSDQLTCFFGAQRYRSTQWEEMVTIADGGQPWNESTNVFQTHVLPNSGMSCGLTTDNLGGRARSITLFPAIPERTPFITSIGFDVGVTGNGQMPVGRLTIDGALSVAGNPAGTDQNPPMLNQRINLAGVFAGGSGHLLGETSQVVLIGRTPATQEIADTEAFIAKMMEGAIP